MPAEQAALRQRLEQLLIAWGAKWRHDDRFWQSDDGREAIYGWGTHIQREDGRGALRVWYDGLDHDIAIYGGTDEYAEWRELRDMPRVLDDVESTLHDLYRL
jgi:hypothetical protein